jgi:uncharacterized repeat protein (TIGR03803 family)
MLAQSPRLVCLASCRFCGPSSSCAHKHLVVGARSSERKESVKYRGAGCPGLMLFETREGGEDDKGSSSRSRTSRDLGIRHSLQPCLQRHSTGLDRFLPIHTFFGGGCLSPIGVVSDLAIDSSGNLYGAMVCGGSSGFGTIFKMTNDGGTYEYADIYQFQNGSDGAYPVNVVLGADGNLYGTTSAGGTGTGCTGGCGVVFEIAP